MLNTTDTIMKYFIHFIHSVKSCFSEFLSLLNKENALYFLFWSRLPQHSKSENLYIVHVSVLVGAIKGHCVSVLTVLYPHESIRNVKTNRKNWIVVFPAAFEVSLVISFQLEVP